jgi:thiol-disulfide isomerase/thioredoxin
MSVTRNAFAALAVAVSLVVIVGAQNKDADYAAAMQKGQDALAKHEYKAAIDFFKKANDLQDKKSIQAYFGLSRAYFANKAFKSAIDSCAEALKYTGADKRLEGQMRYMRGLSLVALSAQENSSGILKDAEADFRATLALTDTIALAQYNLGVVLLKENRDADGLKELQAYVERGKTAPEVDEARKMMADPRRARIMTAPNFTVPTLQGERVSLQDYRGKVVLLDFWGTWCPPCRAFTPTLVEVNKRMADQPFITLGVAVDEKTEEGWKSYIAENKMTWPQYLDKSKTIARLFDVREFPTYILIDHEGLLRDRKIGASFDNAAWLNDQLKTWVKAAKGAPGGALFLQPGR